MKKIINIIKENKDISITFTTLLLLSMIFGFNLFMITLLIEIGFVIKWDISKKERIKFTKREKGIFTSLIVILFLLVDTVISNTNLMSEIENLEQQVVNEESKYNGLSEQYNKIVEKNRELETKVKEAEPWFEMKEEERLLEQKRIEEEKKAQEEKERKEREAEEQRKAEEERKAKEEAEKKEKQGYNTGITYSQLARTPDKYEGEKVKFSGKVLQVSEGLFSDVIRLGVNGSYDNVIYLTVPMGITEERILEDDYITIYGVSEGITTYTTVMGASVSIPSVSVDKIDR